MSPVEGRRVLVLGAGFSAPAGLSLGDELWKLVRAELATGPGTEEFKEGLQDYLDYRRACDGVVLNPDEVDYEEFLAFLDIEHRFLLAGSDTWSAEGNRTQVAIKTLIGKILVERTPPPDSLPDIYYSFAKQLEDGDVVISFNYDNLLERALDHVGRPYRLCHHRGSHEGIQPYEKDPDVVVLKLHGSVDWFDCTQYEQLEAEYLRQGHAHLGPNDPVFSSEVDVEIRPICQGADADDPTKKVYRVLTGLEYLYKSGQLLDRVTPFLLTPSRVKLMYADRVASLWYGLGQAGGLNLGLAVIGYSLPSHDEHAKQALFRLIRNYQDSAWDTEWFPGRKKTRLLMVNRKQTTAEREDFERHYGFLRPEKTHFHYDGFDSKAIELISRIGTAH